MSSGRYVTSWMNSRGRVSMSVLCGTDAIAMGDDCVEGVGRGWSTRLSEDLSDMGWRGVFEIHTHYQVPGVSFCSQLYYERPSGGLISEPVNWRRMLYRLLSKPNITIDDLAQFLAEVRNLRERAVVERVITFCMAEIARSDSGGGSDSDSGETLSVTY